MERLTERTADGILVKENHGENGLRTFYQCFGEKPNDKYTNCDEGYCAIEKLADYEDAEEQGLLLRLPCKVGTSVYMVAQDCGGDTLDCMRGDCEGCPYLYSFVEENTFEVYMCDEVGKTVFLTQAEAEQKLKEMEGD